jgi:hypothetical protein
MSALDGGEWSGSCPRRFTPWKTAPGTHWIGCFVGPRDFLDAVEKRKISCYYYPGRPSRNLSLYQLSYATPCTLVKASLNHKYFHADAQLMVVRFLLLIFVRAHSLSLRTFSSYLQRSSLLAHSVLKHQVFFLASLCHVFYSLII